jgi:hypothetical protein
MKLVKKVTRTLRIRNKELDVKITLWKLLPVFFMILFFLLSAGIIGGSGGPSGSIPMMD